MQHNLLSLIPLPSALNLPFHFSSLWLDLPLFQLLDTKSNASGLFSSVEVGMFRKCVALQEIYKVRSWANM